MKPTVDEYVAKAEGSPGEIARALRALLRRLAPDLSEEMKWGQPVFSLGGPVCYFRAGKSHVTFGFWRGVALMKINENLESGGDMMAHLKLRTLADVDDKVIGPLVAKAIELNRSKGDPTRERRQGLTSAG